MKKIGVLIDSEFGLSEKEARDSGFYFVPVVINWNNKEMLSGVDATLDFIYKNLNKEVEFKTAAPTIGAITKEYRRALSECEKIIVIPISKHLSSTYNVFKLVSKENEFKDKVTVYESEFIGPWALIHKERLINMVKNDATIEEIVKLLDVQRGNMIAWLFPGSLERVYASGRLTRAQYMAGSLLKIKPVMQIINGRIDNSSVVKARSSEKAIKIIVKNTVEIYKEKKKEGLEPIIMFATLGDPEENEYTEILKEIFEKEGFKNVPITWLPPAIVGHVGTGGIGSGILIKVDDEYKKE